MLDAKEMEPVTNHMPHYPLCALQFTVTNPLRPAEPFGPALFFTSRVKHDLIVNYTSGFSVITNSRDTAPESPESRQTQALSAFASVEDAAADSDGLLLERAVEEVVHQYLAHSFVLQNCETLAVEAQGMKDE